MALPEDDGREYRPLRRDGAQTPSRSFRRLDPLEGEPFLSDRELIERSEGQLPPRAWPWPQRGNE